MKPYVEWLKEVIGSLKRDCEHPNGDPIVPIDASVDLVAKNINKYVDEETLIQLHAESKDPLFAAQTVTAL